jgi:hypothetical protein
LTPIKPEDGAGADSDPEQSIGVQPNAKGKKVLPKIDLPSRWVVEVIGGGGKVDEVLGEFSTFRDASYCSVTWSEDHPDDLRLTREREVATGKGGSPLP